MLNEKTTIKENIHFYVFFASYFRLIFTYKVNIGELFLSAEETGSENLLVILSSLTNKEVKWSYLP